MFEEIQVPESVQLPKGRRACRRQANELRAAYQLHRQFAAFAKKAQELPLGLLRMGGMGLADQRG